MTVAGRVRWVGFCVVPDERILRGWLCEPAEHGFFPRCIPSRKMLVDRLYPALSRHEIATAQGEAIQLRWKSEMKQAADELQAILNARSLPTEC